MLFFALGEDTTALRIEYDAPASCPSEAELYDAIRARTDHARRAAGDEPAVDVNVRLTRGERGFTGEVRETVNHNESSARSVEGATCKEVVEALSLTIALSVDPNAHAPRETPAPKPAPEAVVCPPAPEPRTVIVERAPELHVELGLDTVATEALSSELGTGGALSATFVRDIGESYDSSLELSLLFADSGLVSEPSDHRSEFVALALDACPVGFRFGGIELAPCALGLGGVLGATGRGIAEPATVSRGWWSAGLDFKLSVLLGRGFVFESALGASAALEKRRFYETAPTRIIAETPVISPILRLGLGYRF
ncbi:MAG TPA: hypothetical protein VHV51_16060 [Polyangiaceae bacterium]|jgi:hypothetical protein|nr:hypothetical protein [Polyangiaceae bacterium]